MRQKRDFDEAEHPRDESGKFTDAGGDESGGGGNKSGGSSKSKISSAKATKDSSGYNLYGGKVKNPGGQWTHTSGGASESEKTAISEYVDMGDYWNKDLREGKKLDAEVKAYVGRLDRVISKSRTSRDAITYRGVRGNKLSAASFRKAIGKTITLKGFTSTSKDEETAAVFGKTMLEFFVPKGSRALDLTQWQGEKELLLPRDLKVKVESVKGKMVRLVVQ